MEARPTAANASFSSKRSMSATFLSIGSSARLIARDGCVRSEVSGPATMPKLTSSAMGVRPRSSALALLVTISAAPPSEICDALPAVIVPSLSNAGRRLPSESVVVSGRTPSSVSTTIGSPLRCGSDTGVISSARRPSFVAVAARSWLFAASSSWCSRVMPPNSPVYFSVPEPMCTASNAHHRPSWMSESTTSALPMRNPARAFGSR